eukprot:7376082-Prymnesium_polylepis.2
MRLAPLGVPAEICFGATLAAGYLAQPKLTEERFVPNTHATRDPEVPPSPTLYRSGDFAMRLASGDMRFCGRMDRQ